MKVRKGEYGVRYASDRDHRARGFISQGHVTLRDAINAADLFLLEFDLTDLMLHVVDSDGKVVEEVSREPV